MIEEWSNERSDQLKIEDRFVQNTNIKNYEIKPIITANDITESANVKLKMFKPFSTQNIYITSDSKDVQDKYECRNYLTEMKECKFNDFDSLISRMNEYRVITLNSDNWQNSECTCSDGLKKYKCKHILVLAIRLNLLNIENLYDKMPLTNKKRRGAPNKTAKALVRQANDLQDDDVQARTSKSSKRKQVAAADLSDVEDSLALRRSKRTKND
jgi:hypothetical protein